MTVSRPGYLRTPISTGVAFENQADAIAALLDELDIPQAAVLGASAGTPFYFANSTLINDYIPWNFLAIGNWAFISDLFNSTSDDPITDTATEWGHTHEIPYSGGTQTVSLHYSKTDGVMNIYERITTNAEGTVIDSLTVIRDGYFRGIGFLGIDPMMLLIIGGAVVGLVIVIVVVRKR
ncbi:hypothetical protein EU528_11965 [Candidatus Thorarchaeota archaeon]|nr:MAG: hypothetical protein EU528_11965 [Candidatus Thorarchaeota archaeon]